MRSWTMTALALGFAASVAACGGDRSASNANGAAAGRDAGSAVGTSGVNAERGFIEDQLEDGQAEVMLARIALERAANPQVKEYAQMMASDHEKAGQELRQIASQAGVQVNAAEPDHDHTNVQEDLTKLSGRDFDRKYIDVMVDEHQEAVDELEKKADSASPEVHGWVARTLPVVRQHLDRARQIKQTLDRAE